MTKTNVEILGVNLNCKASELSHKEHCALSNGLNRTNRELKELDRKRWAGFEFYCQYGYFQDDDI